MVNVPGTLTRKHDSSGDVTFGYPVEWFKKAFHIHIPPDL
jgi:hypothetical protein